MTKKTSNTPVADTNTGNTDVATIDNATGTAVAPASAFTSKFAAFAKEAAAVEAPPAGTPVTFKAGILKFGGNACAGNKLDVITIASVFENAYYVGDFDSDNPRSPVCFAFGTEEEGMVPHPKSAEPQHETCAGCPQNAWGSAEKGKGKACKNIRRIGLLPANATTVEAIATEEMAYAKLPVTSVKEWSKYVNMLGTIHSRPPFGVTTQLGAKPDEKSQFKVTFAFGKLLDEELADALAERHTRAVTELQVPYTPNTEAAKSDASHKAAAGSKKF